MGGGQATSKKKRVAQGADINFMAYPAHYMSGAASLLNQPMSADSPPEAINIPDFLNRPTPEQDEMGQLFSELLNRFQSRIEDEGLNKYIAF